jgi:hypothetical protein
MKPTVQGTENPQSHVIPKRLQPVRNLLFVGSTGASGESGFLTAASRSE